MHDADVVGVGEPLEDLGYEPERLRGRDGTLAELGGQVAAGDELGDEVEAAVELAVVVDRDDVRAAHLREHGGLAGEPGAVVGVAGEVGRDDLQRDLAVEAGVAGGVHEAHAALTERSQQHVATELVADRRHPDHLRSRD